MVPSFLTNEELPTAFGFFDQGFVAAQGVLDDFRVGGGFRLCLQDVQAVHRAGRQVELDAVLGQLRPGVRAVVGVGCEVGGECNGFHRVSFPADPK
jgi:hypothetical protein